METLETPDSVRPRPRQAVKLPWRMFILVVFPISYFLLERAIPPVPTSFKVYTLLNIVACGVLLWNLNLALRRTLWIWVALVLFLDGYFLKMAWFAHKLDNPAYINLYYSEVRWVARERVLASYSWVTFGFVTFCIVALATLRYGGDQTSRYSRRPIARLAGPTIPIVVATSLGYLMVMFLQITLNYGVLGLANPSIPFHLGSGITLFQRSLAPGILLLAVWIFDQKRSRWANITTVLIALFGIVDSVVTTSRGSLITMTVPVFFLWMLTNRFTARRKLAAISLLLTATLLYPFLSSLRQERLDPSGGSQPTTISADGLLTSGFILVNRVGAGGVDGVWWAMNTKVPFSPGRTLGFLKPNRLTVYYTESIVHVAIPNDYRPAGWIGGLMIVGGAGGVLVLGSGLLVFLAAIWRRLQRLQTWPVSLALGANTIAGFISAGNLDLLLLIKLAIQVTACELIYRKLHNALPGAAPDLPGSSSLNVAT